MTKERADLAALLVFLLSQLICGYCLMRLNQYVFATAVYHGMLAGEPCTDLTTITLGWTYSWPVLFFLPALLTLTFVLLRWRKPVLAAFTWHYAFVSACTCIAFLSIWLLGAGQGYMYMYRRYLPPESKAMADHVYLDPTSGW